MAPSGHAAASAMIMAASAHAAYPKSGSSHGTPASKTTSPARNRPDSAAAANVRRLMPPTKARLWRVKSACTRSPTRATLTTSSAASTERRGDDPVGREQPARTVERPAAHRLAATQREESGHGAEERDAELALVEHEDVPGHGKVRHLEDVTEDDEEQRDAAQPVEADEAAATAGVGRHHVGASAAVGSVAGTSAAAAATASRRRIRRSTTIERKITTQKYFSYSALMKVPATAKPTKPARSPSPHPASSSASGEP